MNRHFIHKTRQVRLAKLLVFFFVISATGIFQSLPFLLSKVANAHPLFIHQEKNQVQMVLHHAGNRDEHDLKEKAVHHHDLFDRLASMVLPEDQAHTDHEVNIPLFAEKPGMETHVFTAHVPATAPFVHITASILARQDDFSTTHFSFYKKKQIILPLLSPVLLI